MNEPALHSVQSSWEAWYKETDPEIRLQMLPALIASQKDDGLNMWRLRLFGIRHKLSLQPDGMTAASTAEGEGSVDRYLWQFVNFSQIAGTSRLLRFLNRREVIRTLQELGITQAVQDGPAGEEAAYLEVGNATRRFLKACQNETYGRSLFGLIPSTAKERQVLAYREIMKVTEELPERLGLTQEMALWTRAVRDAYAAWQDH